MRRFTTLESCRPDVDAAPGVYRTSLFTHRAGELFSIFTGNLKDTSLALTILAEQEPGTFTVAKSPRSTDHQLDAAYPWMFEGDTAKIAPGGRLVTGLLLVPSVIGVGLFGARQAPDAQTVERFGSIHLAGGPTDGYMLGIDMPSPPHQELGSLIICREFSEPQI